MKEKNANSMTPWPSKDVPNLQIGVPRFARHIVIHGLHQYCTSNCPIMIVTTVQFLQEGGAALEGFEYAPMANNKMVKAIHGTFSANSRFVFISSALHKTMFNISNSLVGQTEKEEDSDNEDNVVISSLVKQTCGKRQRKCVEKMNM